MGRDTNHVHVEWNAAGFQSTRPHGAQRLPARADRRYSFCFNPRARMGRDSILSDRKREGINVSIHAPAWGATPFRVARPWVILFQSTRPHGARLPSGFHAACATIRFNPRARMGRDTLYHVAGQFTDPFQSTRPHGARPL